MYWVLHVEPTGADWGIWINRTAVKELELGENLAGFSKSRGVEELAD